MVMGRVYVNSTVIRNNGQPQLVYVPFVATGWQYLYFAGKILNKGA